MPSLPTVTSEIPRDLRQFLERVRENINGRGEDELVTVRKLVAAGIATYNGGTLGSNAGDTYYGIPPAPLNLEADGALANILVTWDKANYNGHAYTEIWAAQQTAEQAAADPEQVPDLGEAQLVGMAPGSVFAHTIGQGGSRWYWVRFVNLEGQVGPYNAVDGVRGDTGTDPAYLIELLNGQISESELAQDLSARIDLIDGPSTTVGTVAYQLADLQGQVNELLNLPTWSSTETYAIDAQVVYEGFLYVALAASTNVEPGTDATKWEQVGEYATIGDAVAAHTTQIGALQTGLGQEITDRTTLATQLRGNYTGNDLSLVSQGLIYEERVARSTETSALAQDIQTLSAFANTKSRVFYQPTEPVGDANNPLNIGDLWIDTNTTYADDYIEGDYVIRSNRMYRYDGTAWVEAMDFGFADWFTAIRSEKTARVTEDAALAEQITTLTSATNGSLAAINQTLSTHTSDISSNANAITALGSELRGADSTLSAAIQQEATTRATETSANASLLTTLQSTVTQNNNTLTAAIQQEASTRADQTGDLFGQYTVKVDLNGYVSGYGLASSVVDGTPSSEFIVRADSFAIGQATSGTPTEAPDYPFIVRTTETTINGETVPAGVYMADAFIANGTITNAKIGDAAIDNAKIANLDAGKITTGYLDAARIEAGSITANLIDSRGLSIKDAQGNVILSAGTPLNVSNIEGLGSLALFSSLSIGDIVGAGALASLDEVTEADLDSGLAGTIDGKMESWFQSSDPAAAWTSNAIKAKHLGDMWWRTDQNKLYRYKYAGGVYSWEQITDQTATDAYSNAATAQDTADRKRQVFVSQPTPPYDVGDLWDRGPTTGIYRCAREKAAGQTFSGSDWQVVADLTGNNEAASISNQGNFATLDQITAQNISTYIASGAIGNAYIGNVIQSTNYSAGSDGWKIDKTGQMEMNNATFRGTLDVGGTSGSRLVIKSDRIEVYENNTLRVRLGNLS